MELHRITDVSRGYQLASVLLWLLLGDSCNSHLAPGLLHCRPQQSPFGTTCASVNSTCDQAVHIVQAMVGGEAFLAELVPSLWRGTLESTMAQHQSEWRNTLDVAARNLYRNDNRVALPDSSLPLHCVPKPISAGVTISWRATAEAALANESWQYTYARGNPVAKTAAGEAAWPVRTEVARLTTHAASLPACVMKRHSSAFEAVMTRVDEDGMHSLPEQMVKLTLVKLKWQQVVRRLHAHQRWQRVRHVLCKPGQTQKFLTGIGRLAAARMTQAYLRAPQRSHRARMRSLTVRSCVHRRRRAVHGCMCLIARMRRQRQRQLLLQEITVASDESPCQVS